LPVFYCFFKIFFFGGGDEAVQHYNLFKVGINKVEQGSDATNYDGCCRKKDYVGLDTEIQFFILFLFFLFFKTN
jgi:hypothetical protein